MQVEGVVDTVEAAALMREALAGRGWFLVWSETLGDRMIVASRRDALASVPAHLASVVVYSTREIVELAGLAPGELRLLHAFKRHFGASLTIVAADAAAGTTRV